MYVSVYVLENMMDCVNMDKNVVNLRKYVFEVSRCANLFECLYLAAILRVAGSKYMFDRTLTSSSEHIYKPFLEMCV